MSDSLRKMFEAQADVSNLFYDLDNLSPWEREYITTIFVASLQKEAGSLLDGINYRHHRLISREPNKILHEGIDVWWYLIGIMNLWGITPEQFVEAFEDRDLFLRVRHEKESVSWKGEPVLIVDMDDVLTNFREECTDWVREIKSGVVDENSNMYYNIPHQLYEDFVNLRKMRTLSPNQPYVDAINELYDQGVWIHILTARPKSNLILKYDTYAWLCRVGVKFNRVSFNPEKYLWLIQTDYFKRGRVVAAVDDSPKHAMEYAQHGILCLMPTKSYNCDVQQSEYIFRCDDVSDFLKVIKERIASLNE